MRTQRPRHAVTPSRGGAASGSEGEAVVLEALLDEVRRDNGHLEVGG
jgi:hypothetical protein